MNHQSDKTVAQNQWLSEDDRSLKCITYKRTLYINCYDSLQHSIYKIRIVIVIQKSSIDVFLQKSCFAHSEIFMFLKIFPYKLYSVAERCHCHEGKYLVFNYVAIDSIWQSTCHNHDKTQSYLEECCSDHWTELLCYHLIIFPQLILVPKMTYIYPAILPIQD